MLGACWSRKVASRKLHSSRTTPRIFGEVVEPIGCGTVITTKRPKTKRGFPYFVRVWESIVTGFGDVDLYAHINVIEGDLSHLI